MDWKKLSVTPEGHLFRNHSFTYLYDGATYRIEVSEYSNGRYSGFGEDSIDKSSTLPPVNAQSLEECLNGVVTAIQKRHKKPV